VGPTDPSAASGLGAWLDPVPTGASLDEASAVAGLDGSVDEDLRDLLGGESDHVRALLDARAHVPRLRPILVALAARSAGAERVDRHALHAAELLHVGLAVHDLALGQQGGRRRRVARRLVKRSVGWFSGNQLSLRALELTRHATRPELMGEVVDTLRAFSQGQDLARELQRGRLPDRHDWLDHADATTAALFAFCCRAGAHLAGADPATVSALGRYGRHLGRLWHVAEDLSALRLGDGAHHLLARACAGRPVLPVIVAAEGDPRLAAEWAGLVAAPSVARAERLAHAVVLAGGVDRARPVVAQESWAARRLVSELPDTPSRRALDRLAASLVRPAAREP
jgi:geranylgeranyl pyrophosphate synthase